MGKTITIQNEFLTVSAKTNGAQLSSIKTHTGIELLWQGNPQIWYGQAPIVFPILGGLPEQKYLYKGKEYYIPFHGFARDFQWEGVKNSECEMVFILQSDYKTKTSYPFDFLFELTYRLEDNKIIKKHRIRNDSDCPMYYQVGGHDAYNIALYEGETMNDYYVDFYEIESIYPYKQNSKWFESGTHEYRLDSGKLYVGMNTFKAPELPLNAFAMKANFGKSISLKNKRGNYHVKLDFPDFPWLLLWTKGNDTDNNYVCLEPCSGLSEATYSGPQIQDKIGMSSLAPGDYDDLFYCMTFEVDDFFYGKKND